MVTWSIPACAGEPRCKRRRQDDDGSIPACAGEPGHGRLATLPVRESVYPRVCGGTGHRRRSARWGFNRSIPACAGEPTVATGSQPASLFVRVYPRVCGGTDARRSKRPAVRTSIPACAGEPRSAYQAVTGLSPRVRGNLADMFRLSTSRHTIGLSPRVRGNHNLGYLGDPRYSIGSIPACAGEPLPKAMTSRYPLGECQYLTDRQGDELCI